VRGLGDAGEVLAVTVLTSMSDDDLARVGQPPARAGARGWRGWRSRPAHPGWCARRGTSRRSAPRSAVRAAVTPGVRPAGRGDDDHARAATPRGGRRRRRPAGRRPPDHPRRRPGRRRPRHRHERVTMPSGVAPWHRRSILRIHATRDRWPQVDRRRETEAPRAEDDPRTRSILRMRPRPPADRRSTVARETEAPQRRGRPSTSVVVGEA
jgi:hypothetical protein